MSEGNRGVARRFSGGGAAAPLTRSRRLDQNTTSRASNTNRECAGRLEVGRDEGSEEDVTSEETSCQVETGEGEKRGLSPGELTGSPVLEEKGSSGQPGGQLIGKPVTHVGGEEVVHIGGEEPVHAGGGEVHVVHVGEDRTEQILMTWKTYGKLKLLCFYYGGMLAISASRKQDSIKYVFVQGVNLISGACPSKY